MIGNEGYKIMTARKKNLILPAEYAVVFVCFMLCFFFILPQSDVFLFARENDGSVASAFNEALYYGNGRLLGNFISMWFSNHFEWAGTFVAVTMTLFVFLMNKLVTNNNIYTVFPIFFLLLVPSRGMLSECYYMFAAYVNYVLPIALFAAILVLVKNMKKTGQGKAKQILMIALVCLFGVASCLFSENTTIVIVFTAISMVVMDIYENRKVKVHNLLFLLFSLVGCAVMIAVPRVTETSENMEHYRGIAVGNPIGVFISSVVPAFSRFSEIFNQNTILIVVISFAIMMSWKNNSKFPKLRMICTCVAVFYAAWSIVSSSINLDSSNYIPRLNLINAVFVGIYFVLMCSTVFSAKNKTECIQRIVGLLIVLSSVAPMMVVSKYGYRTYYTTFFVCFLFACMIIKQSVDKESVSRFIKSGRIRKPLIAVMGAFSVLTCTFIFMQTVYNYDFYIYRSENIAEQINSGEEIVETAVLPCDAVSNESAWPNIIADSYGGNYKKIKIVDISSLKNNDFYYDELLNSTMIDITKFAFEHLEYRDPLLPQSLIEK